MRFRSILLAFLAAVTVMVQLPLPASARDGNVIYNESTEGFLFTPGSRYSPTDLFPELKDVMPGDSLHQRILLRNEASRRVKVRVYMRSLGAQAGSEAFLSQLDLTVRKCTDTVMFDAAADQTAQLTDWVYLGTLYSGGEVELEVGLDVPVTLDNRFQEQIGYLDWEFLIEELPVADTDPKPPQTGDTIGTYVWIMAGSALLLAILAGKRRKEA